MRKPLILQIILFSLLMLLASPMLVRADTPITDCANLNVIGERYYLTADILNDGNSTCFQIQTDDITLDCQGYTVDGNDTSATYGFYASNRDNITIKNCVFTDWYYGIYFYTTTNSEIVDVATNSNNNGIEIIESSNNNQLTNIIANSNTWGIRLRTSSNNSQLINITVDSNTAGIQFDRVSNNTVINSKIQDNNAYTGIDIYDVNDCYFYNNLLNNTANFVFSGSYANDWNTTQQAGTRIYSDGTDIGGNYWTNSAGNGYSDTCTDANYDGFCDDALNLTTNNWDYLPLSDEYLEVYLVVTFNFSSVSFELLQAGSNNNTAQNQTNGVYNVTVNTGDYYKVEASGLNFTDGGSEGFGIDYLRIDTNSTLGNMALGDSIVLSESNQVVNTNIPSTETANFFGFWLSIPSGQYATTYNSNVTITYSQV